MDGDLLACVSYIVGAAFSGLGLGYHYGNVKANPSEKIKCHKHEGSRGSQVTVKVIRWFFGRSFNCRLKKGDTCLLDNTKCDFKP